MQAARGWFVTGTDTGVGKTLVSLGLMRKLQQQGYLVAGMKPVASGCAQTSDGLRNDDALRLQRQSSLELDYARINPWAFAPPIAPHLAAAQAGVRIDTDLIEVAFSDIAARVDYTLVEGIGGWLVPLNEQELLADLAARLQLPVILVVGIRLGCLNHALLTVDSIQRRAVHLAGWVANHLHPADAAAEAAVAALGARIPAPLLGAVPWLPAFDVNVLANSLRLPDPGVADRFT